MLHWSLSRLRKRKNKPRNRVYFHTSDFVLNIYIFCYVESAFGFWGIPFHGRYGECSVSAQLVSVTIDAGTGREIRKLAGKLRQIDGSPPDIDLVALS